MENYGYDEIHGISIKMLEWFHGFCKENKLRYYAVGGTMLGAVRHKGFIPWDDDIDVGMPREDYNRFIALTKDKVFGRYSIESVENKNPDYIYPFAKIYDEETTLVEKARVNIVRGIYIDVFPLDGAGADQADGEKKYMRIKKLYDRLTLFTAALNKKRKWFKNLAILSVRLIPKRIISAEKIIRKINGVCEETGFDACVYAGNLVGNWGKKEIMPREFFGEPKEYRFENISVCGVEKPDLYLRALYGNYMEFPPEEKRKSHHNYAFQNLKKPYKKYIEEEK